MEWISRGLSTLAHVVRRTAVTGCMAGLPMLSLGSDYLGNSSTELPSIAVTRSTSYATAGFPFSALVSRSGVVLVSVTTDGSAESVTGVQVFKYRQRRLIPDCVNALPASLPSSGTEAMGLSLFHEEKDAAMGLRLAGEIFYRVKDLVACNSDGYVVPQAASNVATFSVAGTRDGTFAFIAQYGTALATAAYGNVGVVAIERDFDGNFTGETLLIGQIPTGGSAVVGMTLSSDGRRLYVITEVAASNTVAAGSGNPILAKNDCVLQPGSPVNNNGLLTVIDVAKAQIYPNSAAIVATVAAGCWPVRLTETRDQRTLWVSARGDNRVLAFSTAALERNPDRSLLGYADTGGTAPVGIRLFHHDRFLAVANSNRFNTGVTNLTILDVRCADSAKVVQTVPTGTFPREINVAEDGSTLYLTNYFSKTFQVIETSLRYRRGTDQMDSSDSTAGSQQFGVGDNMNSGRCARGHGTDLQPHELMDS